MTAVAIGEMKVASIRAGERVVLDIFIIDEETQRPFDLTNFDEFSWCIRARNGTSGLVTITQTDNGNGSTIVKNPSVSDQLGHLILTLSGADSNLLDRKTRQYFEVLLNNSVTPNPKVVPFEDALDVKDAICITDP